MNQSTHSSGAQLPGSPSRRGATSGPRPRHINPRGPRGSRGLCGNGAECESPRSRSLCAARAPQGRTATRPRPVRPLRPTGPTGSARLRTPNRRGELPASHPRSYHLYIRTRSLVDPGVIEDVCQGRSKFGPLRRSKSRPVGEGVAVFVGRLERSLRSPFRAAQA